MFTTAARAIAVAMDVMAIDEYSTRDLGFDDSRDNTVADTLAIRTVNEYSQSGIDEDHQPELSHSCEASSSVIPSIAPSSQKIRIARWAQTLPWMSRMLTPIRIRPVAMISMHVPLRLSELAADQIDIAIIAAASKVETHPAVMLRGRSNDSVEESLIAIVLTPKP